MYDRRAERMMVESDNAETRIDHWAVLPGLPGEGPIPKHFHHGHPTPWAEGFVIRFWSADGSEWVGNFINDGTSFGAILDWPEAEMVVVIASGAGYFLPRARPGNYMTCGSGITGALFDEGRSLLILSHIGGDLLAFDRSGAIVWKHENLSVDGIRLISCEGNKITTEIECDDEGSWRTVHLRAADGTDIDRKRFITLAWPHALKALVIATVWYVLAYWALLNVALPALCVLAALQFGWLVLSVYRAVKLLRIGAARVNAPDWIKEDLAFWLAAVVSSVAAVVLVLLAPVKVG